MKADKQTESEVKQTLNRFNDAFSRRDLDGFMKLVIPDSDVTWFGTGLDEERRGLAEIKAQLQRDWAESESASLEWSNLSISNKGPVAWIAGDVTVTARLKGKDVSFLGRVTAVMEKRDGGWLFDQWHLSAPMAGQERGHSFPT